VASLAAGGIQATGVYSVATSLAELLLFVPLAIRLSLFPIISAGTTADANRLTPAACRHTLLLTSILALILVTAGPLAIHRLYGEVYAGAIIPLLLLLPGIILLSQSMIIFSDLSGRGKPGVAVVSTLLSLMLTIILDFVLIPKYGITGAALASSCAYMINFVVGGFFFTYHSGLSWRELFLFRKSDLSSYMGMLPDIRKGLKLAH
jgi:O-antigen/teichoic acid export membrane protein